MTYTNEPRLTDMLAHLEKALTIAGYDVCLVYDPETDTVEASNLSTYTHTLFVMDYYPKSNYRDLLWDILKAVHEAENDVRGKHYGRR